MRPRPHPAFQVHDVMTDATSTGARIKRFRQEQGLSLTELAQRAGISKGYLWTLESDSGSSRPSADTLLAISGALGVSLGDLLGRSLRSMQAPNVNEALREFASEEGLPESDLEMLAGIQFRGEQPTSKDRWRYIYQAIKSSKALDG